MPLAMPISATAAESRYDLAKTSSIQDAPVGRAIHRRQGAGKEARLCFMGHLLMEYRSGLVVAARLTQATGLAERQAASMVVEGVPGRHRITVGADRAYDTTGFVTGLRRLNATPHVAQNVSGRRSRIDRRTVCHPGYLASQRAQAHRGGVRLDQTIAGSAVTCARVEHHPACHDPLLRRFCRTFRTGPSRAGVG